MQVGKVAIHSGSEILTARPRLSAQKGTTDPIDLKFLIQLLTYFTVAVKVKCTDNKK